MSRSIAIIYPLFLLLALVSCRKTEEIVIRDNTAPPDYTVADVTLESYINRSYISLLGRKPTDAEFATGLTQLRLNNVSQSNRETFLDGVFSNPYYPNRLFDVGRSLYLNGSDTTEFQEFIDIFEVLLQDTQYQAVWPEIREEISKMQRVLDIPLDLGNGSIDIVEMHRRLCYNYVYDQINMGTQNFVVSMFQNFFFRYPTVAELEAGETMVDGFNAIILLQTGQTKVDFIAIFLRSKDYAEGQVRDVFTRFLFREPMTEEMERLSIQFVNNWDYEALLKAVMTTNEYVGL
ncbi:MAG TPA: hypothetical protein ENJ82_11130 [Bacteroidetes bacterium]|nr:hypothetical protein [Bacteroidota bacterium]